MKKVCALIIAVTMAFCITAFAHEGEDGFEFEHTSAGMILVGYHGHDCDVVILDSVDGSAVTIVASNAFSGAEIISVTLPETITVVQNRAFSGCTALESVIMLSDTCAISPDTFSECSPDMVLYASENSTAIILAETYGINHEPITDSSVGIIGGNDGPTSIFVAGDPESVVIGGGLAVPSLGGSDTDAAPGSEVPSETSADDTAAIIGGGLKIPATGNTPSADSVAMCSFHDFTGVMPYEFVNATQESSSYYITYRCDDSAQLEAYLELFSENGWMIQDAGSDETASYIFAVSPDSGSMFYTMCVYDSGMVTFVYDASCDYGFDPTNGL